MKNLQVAFLVIGGIGLALLIVFPPQIVTVGDVRFLPLTDGHPIDWLHFFFWVVLDLSFVGLGIAANKCEHR